MYDETFSYDPNGNLLTLQRWDYLGAPKDDFHYKYYGGTNKLYEVHALTGDLEINSGTLTSDNVVYKNITLDGTATVAAESDVEVKALEEIKLGSGFVAANDSKFYGRKVMTGATYEYDSIGNLIRDNEKGVSISWTPQGKVRSVDVGAGTSVTTFRYDAMGNRVEKKVVKGDTITTTRYLRDASGNVMSVYNDTTMIEQPIYGSSRLGQYIGHGIRGKVILGLRRYEIANHLGNVLSVLSDNIYMHEDTISSTVINTSDYYPFGSSMSGRTWNDTTVSYRFGFNGQEKVTEISSDHYTASYWEYDSNLGRRWNIDPVTKSSQGNYSVLSNSPLWRVDPDGDDDYFYADGSYSHSTKSGTKIIIRTAFGDKSFSELPMNNMYNRKSLANITAHYANKIGIFGPIGVSNYPGEEKKALAFTQGYEILVNARVKGVGVTPLFDDYNNLQSALTHEDDHKAKDHGVLGLSKLDHLGVYLAQVKNEVFKKTTAEFKTGIAGSIASYIEDAAYDIIRQGDGDLSKLSSMISEFNKVEEITGYSFSLVQKESGYSNPNGYKFEAYANPVEEKEKEKQKEKKK